MAYQLEEDRSLLVASESEGSEIEVQPKTSSTSSSKRRVIACVVGLAVLGLVAWTAASQQAGQSLRNGNVQDAEVLVADEASSFYFVKSTWKDASKADEWWQKANDMTSDPSATKKATEEDTALGLHMLFNMPTGKASTMYAIWEAKHGVDGKEAIEKHLNHDTETACGQLGGYFHNEAFLIPSKLTGPFPYSFFSPASRRLAEDKESTYYLVHHTFPSDTDVKTWWKDIAEMMGDEEAWGKAMDKMKEAGLANPLFAPLAPEGPIYCLWKAGPGKTQEYLKDYLDSNLPMSKLNNELILLPNDLTGGYPGPYLPQ